MRSDCHMHMILDGYEWKAAIARHGSKPDDAWIRQQIEIYYKQGYTSFIGKTYGNFREYRDLIVQQRGEGADFVKIMISGLMDFDCFGRLTEEGLPPEEIRELIHIAHEEGFAVMAHCNGARTAEAAAAAGLDSV